MLIDLENFPTSPAAIRMLNTVTKEWYEKSYVGKWIYQVMGSEIDSIENIVKGLKNQIFAETATWGIIYHETRYGITLNPAADLDDRRKAVIIKRDHANRMPWTPYFVESFVWSNFSLKSKLVDHEKKFASTLEILVGAYDSIKMPSKVLDRVCAIKPSHIAMNLLCSIETAEATSTEQILFDTLDMKVDVADKTVYEMPNTDIKLDVHTNFDEKFVGSVMFYKALNRWDGKHRFDGTIRFDTEVREEELRMEAKMTKTGKTKLLRARAGEISMPKVTGFAFGTGGVTPEGAVQPVGEGLKAEFLRKTIDNYVLDAENGKTKYYCTLSEKEAVGKAISEIGLYDAQGDIIMVSNFTAKGKDDGLTMRFEIDDIV